MPHDHVYEVPLPGEETRTGAPAKPHPFIEQHRYLSIALACSALLLIGALIVQSRRAVNTRVSDGGWSVAGVLSNGTAYVPATQPARTPAEPLGATTTGLISYAPSETPVPVTTKDDGFDFDAFIAQLTKGSGVGGSIQATTSPGITGITAYSYIPQGLVSTTTTKARTEAQQKLYNYGNEAGSYIQTYDETHHNQVQQLADFIQDRSDPGKQAAVRKIGNDLAGVGTSLEGMEDVPPIMQNAHTALAHSYQEIGNKLAHIPDTNGDQSFLAAINDYNSSADVFTKHYIAVVNILAASEVKFSSYDAGSVFTFSSGGGL